MFINDIGGHWCLCIGSSARKCVWSECTHQWSGRFTH